MDLLATCLQIASVENDTSRRKALYDAACDRWTEHAVRAGLRQLGDKGLLHYPAESRDCWLTAGGLERMNQLVPVHATASQAIDF